MPALSPARWAELSPHLDELLTLPPLDRVRWLDALAANDPHTAADLRELLASREGASRVAFLGGWAAEELVPAELRSGAVLGPWTLVESIGEGGMGAVWRARRSDGRFEGGAAIKLLKSGLFDRATQERFRREGAILARLHHPGIAQLLDAGITPQGQPYLVLELVQGERIDRWCEARQLDVRGRIELFEQVLEAVQAAHAQLTIHRDLKPSNILVGDDGRVKLLDFGIARLLPGAEGEQTALTREGSLALTPEYAAPEQFEGGVLSVATDVYALGVVLFELLAGTHPMGLPAGATPLQHMQAVVGGAARRASLAARPERQAALRGDLDNILAKALRVAPGERYDGVAAFARDLRAHLAYRPVAARPDAWAYRLHRFALRNRVGVALSALALLVAVAGVAGTALQARRATEQADLAQRQELRAVAAAAQSERLQGLAEAQTQRAVREAANATESAVRAETARRLATQAAQAADSERRRADGEARNALDAATQARRDRDRTLHELDFADAATRLVFLLLGEAGDRPVTSSALLQQAVERIDRQYASDPEQHTRLLALVAFQLVQLGRQEQAQVILDRAYRIARETGQTDALAVLDCQSALSGADSRPAAELVQLMGRAIQVLLANDDHTNATVANCLTGRSGLLGITGDAAASLADADRALAWFGQPRPSQRLSAMSARAARATALNRLGRWAEGAAEYRQLLAELQTLGERETQKAAVYLSNMGSTLDAGGQTREAAAAYQQAVDLRRSLKLEDSPFSMVQLADLRSRLGDPAADALAEQALAAAQRGQGPRIIGNVSFIAAAVACRSGELALCGRLLATTRRTLQPMLAPTSRQGTLFDMLEARLNLAQGLLAEAQVLIDRALPALESTTQGSSRIEALLLAAELNRRSGRLAEARALVARASPLAASYRQGGPASEWAGRVALEDAELCLAEGRRQGAVVALREALVQFGLSLGEDSPATLRLQARLAAMRGS